MTRKLQLILIFMAGILCGVLIVIGVTTLMGREGLHVGGEALILPLFALLVYFGWSLGNEYDNYRRNYDKAKSYKQGYREGIKRASIDSRVLMARHGIQ